MASYLPPEIWTLILKHASGSPRPDILLSGQHLKAALKPSVQPSAILEIDTKSFVPSHTNVNGICNTCSLYLFDQGILLTACLVAKQCYDGAASLLYREPVIPRTSACMLLLRTLVERPDLADHVRWLHILEIESCVRAEGRRPVDQCRLPPAFIKRYDEIALRSGTPYNPLLRELDGNIANAAILSFMPNLRKTIISHPVGQVGGGLLPHSLLGLRSVELSQLLAPSNDVVVDLHGLSEAAPNISTLTLRGYRIMPKNSVYKEGMVPMFANVTCLSLVKCFITGDLFGNFMKAFPRVEQLDFLRPERVIRGTEFVGALAQYNPHLLDLRVQFMDQRWHVMKFHQELAKLKRLQRLWVPFSCFVGVKEEFSPEELVKGLPSSLQHLSMILALTAEDLMSQSLQVVAANASLPDARFPELRSVMVSGWDFDVGNSGPTSRNLEIEEAMVLAGQMMDAKGIRLTVEGGVANLQDHYMGFDRVVKKYAVGDQRETEKDEILVKGHSLGEWGTMARWCKRQRG